MRVEPCPTLERQLVDHFGLTELARMGFNVCGTLACQVHFSFSKCMQRKRRHVSRQPGRASSQLTPTHQTTPPQKPEESYFTGLPRQQCIVDVEQRSDGTLSLSFSDIVK
jgi:hypothetical protein